MVPFEILSVIAAGLSTAVSAGLVRFIAQRFLDNHRNESGPSPVGKLQELITQLRYASGALDSAVAEMEHYAEERSKSVREMEEIVSGLRSEAEMREAAISQLKDLNAEGVRILLEMIEPQNRQSRNRDYILFLAGVFVTVAVSSLFYLL